MTRIKQFFSMHKKLLKDYLKVISGASLGRGLSFITSLILARKLGIAGFGIFSVFFTVLFLVWQFPTVIDAVYVRFVKVETAGRRQEYLKMAFFIKCAIFFVFLIFSYPLAQFLSLYVFKKPELGFYLFQAIIAGAFLSMYSSVASIYLAKENFTVYSIMNLIFYAMVFTLVLGLVFFREITPLGSAYVFSLSAAGVGCFGMLYIYKRVKPIFPLHISLLRDMLHFGKWLFAENFTYLILQRMDVLFLTRFTSFAELGIYSAAVRMAMLAALLTSSATAIFMPRGCGSCKSESHMRFYLKETLAATAALSSLIVLLMIFSPFMIKLFFGKEYMNCLLATRFLLLEAIFVVLYTPFSYIFYASGNTKIIFILGITKLLAVVIGLSLFIPVLGANGAALSLAISSFIGLVFAVVLSAKIIKNTQVNYGFSEELLKKTALG